MRLPAIGRWVFYALAAALLFGLSMAHWRIAYMELFHGDVPTGVLFLVVGCILYVATLRVIHLYILDLDRKPKDPEDLE